MRKVICFLTIIAVVLFPVLKVKADGEITQIRIDVGEISESVNRMEEEMEAVRQDADSLMAWLREYSPSVTNIYSINNQLENCYYKPAFADIPDLEAYILQDGFLAAYSGYFDVGNNGVNVSIAGSGGTNAKEEYDGNIASSRAIKVLGHDFLLADESYDIMQGQVTEEAYEVVLAPEYVEYSTAVMDIYKAVGQCIYDVGVFYEPDSSIELGKSPVTADLASGVVSQLDTSRGKTNVFITRTNREYYVEKARGDLTWTRTQLNSKITNGEFIVLLANLMNLYGEPVLSKQEENLLLQVYGGGIPTYLSMEEQDAYLYLKSRGVLNLELDYTADLKHTDMLEILMCVADKDSRTNWKEIQPVLNLGDTLVEAGYFPKQITLASDDTAVSLDEEVSYDYSQAEYYDYYIRIEDDKTRFVKSEWSGVPTYRLFVPEIPSEVASNEAMEGSEYLGIAYDQEGVQYYHFRIPKAQTDEYKRAAEEIGCGGHIQINSLEGDDNPYSLWVEPGGGIYFSEQPEKTGRVLLTRSALEEHEFPDAVTVERQGTGKTASLWDNVEAFFYPLTVKAASGNSALVTYKINNAGWIKRVPEADIVAEGGSVDGIGTDTVTITCPIDIWSKVKAEILQSNSGNPQVSYTALAALNGGLMVSYGDLVESGVILDTGNLPLWEKDNQEVLVLNTTNGQIKVNNESREILVGSVLYKVPNDGELLFQYDVDASGKNELYIDFRVAFGWTANKLDILITGTGSSYTVNVTRKAVQSKEVESVFIHTPSAFRTVPGRQQGMQTVTGIDKVFVVPKKSGVRDYAGILMASQYSLSNYLLFEGRNYSTGRNVTFLFVFYTEEAFKDHPAMLKSLKAKDGLGVLESVLGYSITADGWVVRAVELQPENSVQASGSFYYDSTYGWVYNIPTVDEYNVVSYLKGDILLPLARDNTKIYDYNVNVFNKCPYGTRPADTKVRAPRKVIDIKGSIRTIRTAYSGKNWIVAAPAGVSNLFGNSKVQSATLKDTLQAVPMGKLDVSGMYYYGTLRVSDITSNGTSARMEFIFQDGAATKAYTTSASVNIGMTFYVGSVSQEDTGTGVVNYYRWVAHTSDGGKLNVEQSDVEEAESDYNLDVSVKESSQESDNFNGFEEFSLSYLIEMIDSGASFVILLAVQVIPLIGIMLTTVLLGFAVMADARIVRIFCNKFIDPVKFLTFGVRNIETITLNNSLLGLMIAYIVFGLVLDGNLLRLIQLILNWYSAAIEVLKS